MKNYDFVGWATRNDILCKDGRTIQKDAFKDNDGKRVTLVYMHNHRDVNNILGYADLVNKDEGVLAYCSFNDTESGKAAKKAVEHGDIIGLSIFSNEFTENETGVVTHGNIKEVSLVISGANPGAVITKVLSHSDEVDGVIIRSGFEGITICHEEDGGDDDENDEAEIEEQEAGFEPYEEDNEPNFDVIEHSDDKPKEKTIKDVLNTLNEEQQDVVFNLIAKILEINKESTKGDEEMKVNAFDKATAQNKSVLTHDDMQSILKEAQKGYSLREVYNDYVEQRALCHAEGDDVATDPTPSVPLTYTPSTTGISGVEWLFPEAKNLNPTPEFIKRDDGWVNDFLGSVHKMPFSRIRSTFADITIDEARAKGYIKGNRKKEEVFTLLKRKTEPTMIYKKQKFDRQDIIDVTDFNVIPWVKQEMNMMLNEEKARAMLIGDGRSTSDDDHISETNIRPIAKDSSLFSVYVPVTADPTSDEDAFAKAFIKAIKRNRKKYKGSGNPTLYTTEDIISMCTLLEDTIGHPLYDTIEKLATALRVKKIVAVEPMEGVTGLYGVLVNPIDYANGADRGGERTMFDDFDIDYNKMIYLMEERCSGALTKPFSAMVICTSAYKTQYDTSGDTEKTVVGSTEAEENK